MINASNTLRSLTLLCFFPPTTLFCHFLLWHCCWCSALTLIIAIAELRLPGHLIVTCIFPVTQFVTIQPASASTLEPIATRAGASHLCSLLILYHCSF